MAFSIKNSPAVILKSLIRKEIVLGAFVIVLLYIVFFTINNNSAGGQGLDVTDQLTQHRRKEPNFIQTLLTADVSDAPTKDNGIFFHETSHFGKAGISFTIRQACAVESAARMNPNREVYLLVLNESKIARDAEETEWWGPNILNNSDYPTHHMADILRFITLWKYGGIYLDLDVLVMKSLEGLRNFAGVEDWSCVAAGVLGFATDAPGRRVAEACLRELKTDFRSNMWSYNGPGVITRVLKNICNTETIPDMTPEICQGFRVYPPHAFYPIHYQQWKLYFTEEFNELTMQKIQNAFAIHTWNKLSSEEIIPAGSQAPYAIIANQYCPKIYRHSGDFF
ncbi:lactosylceramide 4-alpha-galactosyltransferase-like isoform X2 [Diachasmimorpha longicaudata]|uniref:lactosylceramide 4-alpha-galactosyltransferase-like isoform X2 n=1 Tax=Diachasmimorpha longicaudata TaxID=58733 RepID=UPI0030B8D7DB